MPFDPVVGEALTIEGVRYRFAEHPHPAAAGLPYGQSGRRGTVYQVAANGGLRALKVFHHAYRTARVAEVAERLRPYAGLPGLQVCERAVLTPQRHAALLRERPDLEYAVLMPWVVG